MNQPPKYTITNESVTVIWKGKTHTVKKGAVNFDPLKHVCLEEDWDSLPKHLTIPKSLKAWAKGKFNVEGGIVFYDGSALPDELNERIVEMAACGEDPQKFFKFWEKLVQNPSYRSVKQLFQFIMHRNIPIDEDGDILAYKGVRKNYKDAHSNTFDNSPGTVNEMPRNQISDDPNVACHEGFHVGALGYASGFSERIMICKVNPKDVVCVPYDSSQEKMRVSRYEVIGHYGSPLPSTTHKTKVPKLPKAKAVKVPKKKGAKSAKAKKKKATSSEDRNMWRRFKRMDVDKLLEQSLADLRKFATNCLHIVGGGRIPGGKPALVKRIIEVRDEQG